MSRSIKGNVKIYKGECQEKYFSLDRKWRRSIKGNVKIYKGECQEKYFSLDRKWRRIA